MTITTLCPRCQTPYHVQEGMAGKPMRCPLATCQQVFVVKLPTPTAPAAPAPAPSPAPLRPTQTRQDGSVGEMVPLLTAEAEAPPPPRRPTQAPAPLVPPTSPQWNSQAPPPQRREPAASPLPATNDPFPRGRATSLEKRAGAEVLEAGDWTAPPVRGGAPAPSPAAPPVRHSAVDTEPVTPAPRPASSRWAKRIIIPFAAFSVLALCVGGVFAVLALSKQEEKLRNLADTAYAEGTIPTAGNHYTNLAKKYPESEYQPYYAFRRDLCAARHAFTKDDLPEDPSDIYAEGHAFLKAKHDDPLLPAHAPDLGTSVIKALVDYCERHVETLSGPDSLRVPQQAEPLIAEIKAVKLPAGVESAAWDKLDQAVAKLRASVARKTQHDAALAELNKIVAQPSYTAILKFREDSARYRHNFASFPAIADVDALHKKLLDGHPRTVKFIPDPVKSPIPPAADDDQSLLFDPLGSGFAPPAPPSDDSLALALVRGVLYGLRQTDGKARWAVRLGIDTTALPVRVPAREGLAELILAPSSDSASITAMNSGGETVWRYRLPSPMLGRPLVLPGDKRRGAFPKAYLPTYSGEVHVIELSRGLSLGRYVINHRLTLGGTHEAGTSRIYFPADDGCVYVLDVSKEKESAPCETVLYSEHPAGSLRGEAVMIPKQGELPAYLVLNQARGLREVELRVFELDPPAAPREVQLKEPAVMKGWTWFSPMHDPEKLVQLSDSATLGVFGIRQARNKDQALFPLLAGGSRSLTELLRLPRNGSATGRAEVIQMVGDEIWPLAGGQLQRFRMAWEANLGRSLSPAWDRPVDVGYPIHASQVIPDRVGGSNLVIVSRPPGRSTTRVTSVSDESGEKNWQRQLGIAARGEPVALTPDGGGPPLWVVMDEAGGLFCLDPLSVKHDSSRAWARDERLQVLFDGLPENSTRPPVLIPGPNGRSAVAMIMAPDNKSFTVRQVQVDGGRRLSKKSGKCQLSQALTSLPILVGNHLVFAQADGGLGRTPVVLPAKNDNEVVEGPEWRLDGSKGQGGPEGACQLAALDHEHFLASDGINALTLFQWKADNQQSAIRPDNNPEPLRFKARITAPPLVLPTKRGQAWKACVVDASGTLSLVDVKQNGDMDVLREWSIGGPVTAGPFLRNTKAGERVGCIVDHQRLLWIDPQAKAPLWTHTLGANDAFVGEPQVCGDVLVAVDRAGRYAGLDLNTGKEVGEGRRLRGSIAPAASAVLFDTDRILAPLTDGTMLLLPVERFRKK